MIHSCYDNFVKIKCVVHQKLDIYRIYKWNSVKNKLEEQKEKGRYDLKD